MYILKHKKNLQRKQKDLNLAFQHLKQMCIPCSKQFWLENQEFLRYLISFLGRIFLAIKITQPPTNWHIRHQLLRPLSIISGFFAHCFKSAAVPSS